MNKRRKRREWRKICLLRNLFVNALTSEREKEIEKEKEAFFSVSYSFTVARLWFLNALCYRLKKNGFLRYLNCRRLEGVCVWGGREREGEGYVFTRSSIHNANGFDSLFHCEINLNFFGVVTSYETWENENKLTRQLSFETVFIQNKFCNCKVRVAWKL